ncbi:hypothetical protein AB4Z54_15470 [Streptomyces sp. MCAF7]
MDIPNVLGVAGACVGVLAMLRGLVFREPGAVLGGLVLGGLGIALATGLLDPVIDPIYDAFV